MKALQDVNLHFVSKKVSELWATFTLLPPSFCRPRVEANFTGESPLEHDWVLVLAMIGLDLICNWAGFVVQTLQP